MATEPSMRNILKAVPYGVRLISDAAPYEWMAMKESLLLWEKGDRVSGG